MLPLSSDYFWDKGIWMQQENEIVGYIYGDVGSNEFKFAVHGENIKKFDYIYVPHKEGEMLAQVIDITRHSDLKFEDAAALLSGEEKPFIKTSMSAFAEVIGYRDNKNLLQSPRTPFDPGTEIIKADENLIRRVLGLSDSKENGAYIGLLKGHDLPVYLNIDTIVQKHVCILAKTGGGK
ncbi:MAG TPA: ATP-binding protein, partial [Thermoplasmatales archaeon]|nr:ATP-binding protein [Thermoplasmatales archaeon]